MTGRGDKKNGGPDWEELLEAAARAFAQCTDGLSGKAAMAALGAVLLAPAFDPGHFAGHPVRLALTVALVAGALAFYVALWAREYAEGVARKRRR